MSIANEIQRIQGAKANIKKAIEDKGVIVGDGTIDTYAEKIGEISGGSEDYLQYAKTVQFNSLNDFGKAEVELNLDKCNSLQYFCEVKAEINTNTVLEHLTINCSSLITNMANFLACSYTYRDMVLKKITLNFSTKNVINISNAFNCVTAVEEIDGTPIDLSSATNITNMFNYNNVLKEVRFVEKSIPISVSFSYAPSISDKTIQSIIDGLADLTGGTSQTLTFHKDVGAKLTDEQKATITSKNWQLVY